ncbi:hypothetical protein CW304_20210 [Bacillus sp. UFRGS-B20]|nr:hypothetical protein CW304_20210 [Bacillus sp. UFRGS-B20]
MLKHIFLFSLSHAEKVQIWAFFFSSIFLYIPRRIDMFELPFNRIELIARSVKIFARLNFFPLL